MKTHMTSRIKKRERGKGSLKEYSGTVSVRERETGWL